MDVSETFNTISKEQAVFPGCERRTFTDCINSCISSGRWTNSLATFIYAVVNSRTDYCNTVLAGAPRTVTDKLQRVLNAAAHFVTGTRKFDRGLGQILHDQLHWLDVPNRVLFKLAVTVHQCPNGRAPPYLSVHCIPVSSADTRRHLRSANRHLYTCRTTFPAQHVRPSGILGCWPDGLELSLGFYLRSNEQHRLFWTSTLNVLVRAILVHPEH